jgi:hypothetical protein
MMRTVKAMIDEDGTVLLDEPIAVNRKTRALVTILESIDLRAIEPSLLSEAALAEGWSGPAEDVAWANAADLTDIGDDED